MKQQQVALSVMQPSTIAAAYLGNPIIRALVQLVPGGMGSAVDVLIVDAVNRAEQRRLSILFNEISVGKIELSAEMVASEPFIHMFTVTARASARAFRDEKIKMLAQLLVHGVKCDITMDEFEENVRIVEDISIREWIALVMYEKHDAGISLDVGENGLQRAVRFWGSFEKDLAQFLKIEASEVSNFMNRIARTGLYEQFVGGFMDYGGGIGFLTARYHRLKMMVQVS